MKEFKQILKIGDEGELVQDLQQRLLDLGYKTTFLKDGSIGELTAEGYFGEVTEAVLESFQAKVLDYIAWTNLYSVIEQGLIKLLQGEIDIRNYQPSGVMDYGTWYVLHNYEALTEKYNVDLEIENPEPEIIEEAPDFVQTLIEIAKAEIGTVEKGGNNYGKRVQEYQRIGSNGEVSGGQPWCQYFMNWCLIKACEKLGLPYKATYSGYTPYEITWGKKKGITIINPKDSQVDIGDWGFVYSASRNSAKHVFLIVGKTKKGTFITIEGNTNPGGGSEGFGVFKRERALPWAIVKIPKLYE